MIPAIGCTMTFDSWLLSRRESFKDKFAEQAIKIGQDRERALEHSGKEADKTISTLEAKITATSDRVETTTKEVNDLSESMEILNKQIRNGDMPPSDNTRLD